MGRTRKRNRWQKKSGESTSSYEFPKEKTASVCRRITADPGSSIGNLCDHADGNRILMDRDDHHDSRIRTQLQVHRKKRKKLVHLPQTDAPDILPIQTKQKFIYIVHLYWQNVKENESKKLPFST